MSLHLFYRTCGRCLTHVPSDLTECVCGHSFDLDKPELARTVEVIRAESEERQYETYLEERLQQAVETLRRVRTAGDSRWTEDQTEDVRLALKAVEVARKDLAAHRQKTSRLSVAAQSARQRQAQRQARRQAPKPEKVIARDTHMPAAPDFAPAMPEKLRAAQSARAELLHKPAPPMQDCPHCSATVAADAARCGCGYEFAGTVLMPPIVLPAEEKTAVKPSRIKSA